eukprot:scaffold6237_cov153-Skeletonema_menzelii.AAC.12
MIYSCITIAALLSMSTATATNTTIIGAETILANETITSNETIVSNEKRVIEGTFTFGSRVEFNNNNNTTFYTGRNHDEGPKGRDSDETIITPTLWPTYAPTPFTKAPVTPIPTYSPTEEPTKVLSPPTPSPPTPSPSMSSTSASKPSPSVSSITGTTTEFPSPVTFSIKNENAPVPSPTWNTVSGGGYIGQTEIPTSFWRRTNKRNLRHRKDQDED